MKKLFLSFIFCLILVGTATAGGFTKDLALSGGVTVTGAYHRIVAFDVNLVDKSIRVELAPYKDSTVEGANSKNYIEGKARMVTIRNWVDDSDPDNAVEVNDYDDFLVEMNKGAIVPALEAYIATNDDYFKTATKVGIP